MPKPPAVIVVGDTHANSTVGLMPPAFITDEGNSVTQNAAQAWLWGCWLDFWDRVAADYAIEAVIVNGDVPQGINFRDVQTMTMNESDQIRYGVEALRPLVDLRARFGFPIYATRGTAYHSGGGGSREETIWREIGAVPDETGRRSRWALWLMWRGKVLHATHHIAVAHVYPHTPLAREQRDMAVRAALMGWPMVDVDIRSHVHKCNSLEKDGRYIVTAPAWQLATEFSAKVAPGDVADIGGLALWLDDRNDLQLRKLLYRPRPPRLATVPPLQRLSPRSKDSRPTTKATRGANSKNGSAGAKTA